MNAGLPREIVYKGRPIITGIFKEPVDGRVHLRALNLDGDRQADLSVHGGPSRAVYVYPAEHYDFWRNELSEAQLVWGAFGENFSTEGLLEDEVKIGDWLRVGTTEVMVTEPRLPCYKLAARFGRDDMIKRFLRSGRTGFYLKVMKEGQVGRGDNIALLSRDYGSITIAELTDVYLHKKNDPKAIGRVLRVKELPESWRRYFNEQLDNPYNTDQPRKERRSSH